MSTQLTLPEPTLHPSPPPSTSAFAMSSPTAVSSGSSNGTTSSTITKSRVKTSEFIRGHQLLSPLFDTPYSLFIYASRQKLVQYDWLAHYFQLTLIAM
jgi:hypothetical protein